MQIFDTITSDQQNCILMAKVCMYLSISKLQYVVFDVEGQKMTDKSLGSFMLICDRATKLNIFLGTGWEKVSPQS